MRSDVSYQVLADLERFGLQPESFGAQLHDAVGAEGVSHPQLADGQQPQRRVGLQLHRGNQDGLVAWVHTAGNTTHTHTHTHSLTTFFMVAPDKMAIYPWNNQLVSFRGRCIFLSPGAKNESRLSEQSGVNVSYCCFNVIEEDEIFSYRRWITVCYIYKTSSSRNLLSPSSQFMSRGFQTKQTWEKRFKVVRVSPINIT